MKMQISARKTPVTAINLPIWEPHLKFSAQSDFKNYKHCAVLLTGVEIASIRVQFC